MDATNSKCIGIMSGTSLDGIDIILCEFNEVNGKISHHIQCSETIDYPTNWKEKLQTAHTLNAYEFTKLDYQYGIYIGEIICSFMDKNNLNKETISFIASHGHTIFHNPTEHITCQIGDGTSIYATTGIRVIYDFRRLDITLKGQGAPLVPIGDLLLFNDYQFCLNLGGFSNISYSINNKRIAYDISPANIVLNHYTHKIGLSYDDKGSIASRGAVQMDLLSALNNLQYYKQLPPKSLGREWVEEKVLPLIDQFQYQMPDILRTYSEHIVQQVSNSIRWLETGKLLITGGGAHNTFLIERLKQSTKHTVFIPKKEVIDYKEALIFALLGWLKLNHKENVLATYTGAIRNSISGIVIDG